MLHSERVIGLVEDDMIMGESIVQRLALEGVTVKWWQSGRDAIKEISENTFEAIVCDIRLPDLNGEDVFREAARSSNAPPFLFITGYGDIDQAVRLMRAGAADYFTKPFEPGRVVRNARARAGTEDEGTGTSVDAGGETKLDGSHRRRDWQRQGSGREISPRCIRY